MRMLIESFNLQQNSTCIQESCEQFTMCPHVFAAFNTIDKPVNVRSGHVIVDYIKTTI
jgi:hypothetical protein